MITAQDALQRLKEGNSRFVAGEIDPDRLRYQTRREQLGESQEPARRQQREVPLAVLGVASGAEPEPWRDGIATPEGIDGTAFGAASPPPADRRGRLAAGENAAHSAGRLPESEGGLRAQKPAAITLPGAQGRAVLGITPAPVPAAGCRPERRRRASRSRPGGRAGGR